MKNIHMDTRESRIDMKQTRTNMKNTCTNMKITKDTSLNAPQIYPSIEDIQPDTRKEDISMGNAIVYHTPTDIEESALPGFSETSMTSPTT